MSNTVPLSRKSRKSSHISLVLLGASAIGLSACYPAPNDTPKTNEQLLADAERELAEAQARLAAAQARQQAEAVNTAAAELEAQATGILPQEQVDEQATTSEAQDGMGAGTALLAGAAAGAAAGYLATKAANNRVADASRASQTPTTTQQPVNRTNTNTANANNAIGNQNTGTRQSAAQSTQNYQSPQAQNQDGTTRGGFGNSASSSSVGATS
ncbi:MULTISPECIES: hypothetical protein [unclassified Moraxella]|uniref:hypothetical protein n=1 Tax=unclassified Moraxella TaxID=2685852 RepID=UPI00359E0461